MTPLNAGSRIRSAGLAAIALPLALALVARLGLGPPPPAAHAMADNPIPRRELSSPLPTLTPEQERVRHYAAQALAQPFAASPMHRLAPEAPIEASPEPPQVQAPAKPTFDVTGVIVSSRHALATINGALRRIGDEVEPGWRLTSIDARQGVLIITGDSGERLEISIRKLVQ